MNHIPSAQGILPKCIVLAFRASSQVPQGFGVSWDQSTWRAGSSLQEQGKEADPVAIQPQHRGGEEVSR